MYITKICNQLNTNSKDFDWSSFFENHKRIINDDKAFSEIIISVREHLKENPIKMFFSFSRLMNNLINGSSIKTVRNTLELGAATGFMSRWLIYKYDAKSTLIDNCERAYNEFLNQNYALRDKVNYLRTDFFTTELEEKFDIVCSFGVIEHFKDKSDIIERHKCFVKNNGFIILIIPLDTPLTRTYYEVFPELNLGYRELLTKNEFIIELERNKLKIHNMSISEGYVYDMIGAVCSL